MCPNPYLGLGLGDKVPSDLDPGPEESLGQLVDVDSEQMGDLLGHGVVGQDGLIRVSLLTEFHVSEEENAGDNLPDGAEVLFGDAHDPHGLVCGFELLNIVDSGNGDVAGRQEGVVLGIFQDVLFWERKRKRKLTNYYP